MKAEIQYVNPDELMKTPVFSQAIIIRGEGNTIYIGGQNAVNAKGELVGKNNFTEQTRQVMRNIEAALRACGATFNDVVKLSINMVQGQDVQEGFKTAQEFMKDVKHPPVITGLFVAGLANPDYLLEIDAIAFTAAFTAVKD